MYQRAGIIRYSLLLLLGVNLTLPVYVTAQPLAALMEVSLPQNKVFSPRFFDQQREVIFQREQLKPEPQKINNLGFDFINRAHGAHGSLSVRAGISELSKKATAGVSLTVNF